MPRGGGTQRSESKQVPYTAYHSMFLATTSIFIVGLTIGQPQVFLHLPTATTQYGPIAMALMTLPRITPFT